MASTCPLKLLPCNPGPQEIFEFTEGGTDEPYFFPGDSLDYFSFFLDRGSHRTTNSFREDPEDTSCDWKVDNKEIPWPLTPIDCTLGADNVKASGETKLFDAIKNFHKPTYNTADILMCALNTLGGRGDAEGGICDLYLPQECQSEDGHKFGGVFTQDFTVNLALGRPCHQTSDYETHATCQLANDGLTIGDYHTHLVTHTNEESHPYWRVSLGREYEISSVVIWNRVDCCSDRLQGATVKLYSGNHVVWTSPPLSDAHKQVVHVPIGIVAETVKIKHDKTGIVSLAEVEVYGEVANNIAIGQPCEQSSEYEPCNGMCGCNTAIDDNTSGLQFTHTDNSWNDPNPWWQVHLQNDFEIFYVEIWNRSDCCTDRLAGAVVTLESADGTTVWTSAPLSHHYVQSIHVPSIVASSVKVKQEHNILSLAEVKVFGRLVSVS